MAPLMAVAAIAGAGLQALGTIQTGRAQQAGLDYEAVSREAKAKEERAASQREAIDKRTEGDVAMSRQRAIAAASGAGVVNPSVLDIYGDTAAKAEYNAGVARYGGESRAKGEIDQANLARARGKAAMQGSVFEGLGQLAGGVSKLNFG